MSRTASSLLGAMLYLGLVCSAAPSTESLTDAQAAHFLITAEQSDIDAANVALKQTSSSLVRAFADETSRKHTALGQKNFAALSALSVTPEDNDYSKSLAGAAAQHQQELSKLSGSAFDKAYVKNELVYQVLVIGVLETRLIPSAKSNELKKLLNAGLAVFKDQQKSMQSLALTLH
jgi:putative membrane protein